MARLSRLATLATLVLALVPATAVHAGKNKSQEDVTVLAGKAAFLAQKAEIEKELSEGDRYREISRSDHEAVLRLLDGMARRLEDVSNTEELSPQSRIELLDDQKRVNALLAAARQDSRMVCEKRNVRGSTMRRTVCETAAARDRRNERGGI